MDEAVEEMEVVTVLVNDVVADTLAVVETVVVAVEVAVVASH